MVQNNKVFELINKEKQRQFEGLELIASENYVSEAVSYTHLRAHETVLDLVCRLLLEKKNHMNMLTASNYDCPHIPLHTIHHTFT